jgi:hypothetical protein
VPLCQNVRFPTRKPLPGCQRAAFSKPHEGQGLCRRFFFGAPCGTLFRLQSVTVRLYSHGAVSERTRCHHRGVKDTPRFQKVPHSSPKAPFSEPRASLLGAVATKSALCRNISIYFGLASLYASRPLPFRPQNRLGNAMCTRSFLFHSFMPTCGAKVMPRSPQGRPKGSQRDRKEPKSHPGTPKNHQKIDLGPHLGIQGRPGTYRGTPRKENDTKID